MVPPSVSRPRRGGGQLGADRVAGPAGVPVDVAWWCPGPTTNGGLLTTRSKRRPATGATRSPRSSSQSWPLSAAVVAAKRSARSERSVAVTRRAWVDRCSACTPQPVPEVERGLHRAADGRAGQRLGGAADAEHVVGVQRPAGPGAGRQVGEHPPVVRRTAPGRRPAAGRRRTARPARRRAPRRADSGASAAATAASGSVCSQMNSRIRVASGSRSSVARSAARKSLRADRAGGRGPSRAAMPFEVKSAPVSAVRSASTPAGESSMSASTSPSCLAAGTHRPAPGTSGPGRPTSRAPAGSNGPVPARTAPASRLRPCRRADRGVGAARAGWAGRMGA